MRASKRGEGGRSSLNYGSMGICSELDKSPKFMHCDVIWSGRCWDSALLAFSVLMIVQIYFLCHG